jgi:hypothetical protein
MAQGAPKGNQFWKLRSKHGRDNLFSDPNLLWETACEYFQWADEHPWYKNEQVKQQAKPFKDEETGKVEWPSQIVSIPTQRPYTLSGLCLYLNCDEDTFKSYGKEETKKDFFVVVHAIREVIDTQQFEGATVGVFNQSIISQKLGLATKINSEQNIIQYTTPVTKEEAREIKKAFDDEY